MMNVADTLNVCTSALTAIQKLASDQLTEGEDAVDRLDEINDKVSDTLYELRQYGVRVERDDR
jgi:tetrahydromethanopterin S-methyltransferase subunit G